MNGVDHDNFGMFVVDLIMVVFLLFVGALMYDLYLDTHGGKCEVVKEIKSETVK